MSGLEPIAVAALTKAIDFLFGEAGKLMEERRLARKNRGDEQSDSGSDISAKTKKDTKAIASKEDIKNLEPKELHLRDIPQEVKHYLDLIHARRQNRRQLEQQATAYGGFTYAPLIVQNQIRSSEQEIYENCRKLKRLVEEAYGYKIIVNGLD
jgi:hypothetical protein